MSALAIGAELLLLANLCYHALFMNLRRNLFVSFLFAFSLIYLVAAVYLGYYKSAYHMMFVALVPLAIVSEGLNKSSRARFYWVLAISLVLLAVSEFLGSSLSFDNKYESPNFYYVWGLVLLAPLVPKYKYWAVLILFCVEIIISMQVGARGMIVYTLVSLVFLGARWIKFPVFAQIGLFLGLTLFYVFSLEIAHIMGFTDYIYSSASNYQRAFLNSRAVEFLSGNFLILDEESIFAQFRDLRYSYDSEELSVHCLYLAFGLFNGVLPALLIYGAALYMVVKTRGIAYKPLSAFLLLFTIFGPDVTVTRSGLLIIVYLYLLSAHDIRRHVALRLARSAPGQLRKADVRRQSAVGRRSPAGMRHSR